MRFVKNASTPQIVVRITSQRGGPERNQLATRMPGNTLEHGDIRFTVADEPADVVVALNYLKYDTRLSAKQGYLWSWHNEPINRTPFAKGFDRIFTHEKSCDPRVTTAPPILDWWVGKSWDELASLSAPEKTRDVSAISSDKALIPGHQKRNQFIELIEKVLPEVEVFGDGRAKRLEDKWDGLAPYKYSVAIENSSKPDYWTEKIADCFMSFTVPIYFGATNIANYFPKKSFIWLPLEDEEKSVHQIQEAIWHDSWEERLPALQEARRLVLQEFSLYAQLTKRIRSEIQIVTTSRTVSRTVHGRRVRPHGWIRGKGVVENARVAVSRLLSNSTFRK